MMTSRLILGDCLVELPKLEADSVDSVVTDPPYGLSFMGKSWDHGVPGSHFWTEALRVAKPGAHLLAFGGTRTFHRLTCAIEDAGWEIRDCIMWVYGSGFPKSLDVSKAIDKAAGAEPKQWEGWGTALKPAWEPIIVARKPLAGTVAKNVQRYGTGAININDCRVPTDDEPIERDGEPTAEKRYTEDGSTNFAAKPGKRRGRPLRVIDPKPEANGSVYAGRRVAGTGFDGGSKAAGETDLGRWPANLIHDGSDEVLANFPNVASGEPAGLKAGGKKNCYSEFAGGIPVTGFGDEGSAARFFYCAKASGSDRESFNNHPTVKPVALMRYLVRLVTREGGTVLDPFAGSGTTGVAAQAEGCHSIGIELNPDYLAIASRRMQQRSLLAC